MLTLKLTKNYRFLALISLGLLGGVAFLGIRQQGLGKRTSAAAEQLVKEYDQLFHEREQKIIKNLLSTIKVSQAEWKKEFAAYAKKQEKRFHERKVAQKNGAQPKHVLSKEVECLAYDLLEQQGIKPGDVVVQAGKSISTNGTCLWINEKDLLPCRKQNEASILHEITHIINKDAFVEGCLLMLYNRIEKKSAKQQKKWASAMKELMYLQEERADTMAGLTSLNHAQVTAEEFADWLQHGDEESFTHPKNSARLAYMNEVIDRMTAAGMELEQPALIEQVKILAAYISPSFVMTAAAA